ncbi:MAG: chemotaxis protein CheW, partial [Acidobacteriota bacterium]
VALVVNRVNGIIDCLEKDILSAESILAGLDYVQGIVKIDGDIIFIHDLDRFLSLDEETDLQTALTNN